PWLFLRCDFQRLWRDARLCRANSRARPLGNRCLHPRSAVEPERTACSIALISAGKPSVARGRKVNSQDYTAPASVQRLQQRALLVGVVGLVLTLIGAFMNPEQF